MKNQVKATDKDLVLTLLLGWAGYWRLKKGQKGLAVLWFFTLGCAGIGWLADIIACFSAIRQRKDSARNTSQHSPVQRNFQPVLAVTVVAQNIAACSLALLRTFLHRQSDSFRCQFALHLREYAYHPHHSPSSRCGSVKALCDAHKLYTILRQFAPCVIQIGYTACKAAQCPDIYCSKQSVSCIVHKAAERRTVDYIFPADAFVGIDGIHFMPCSFTMFTQSPFLGGERVALPRLIGRGHPNVYGNHYIAARSSSSSASLAMSLSRSSTSFARSMSPTRVTPSCSLTRSYIFMGTFFTRRTVPS